MITKKIGNYVYYVQRNKRTIREVKYDYEYDEYVSSDATLLSEHITGESIVDLDCQQAPYNMLWCVSEDGHIAVMTRQIEQKVKGWSRITTDGDFESIAVIPGEPPE